MNPARRRRRRRGSALLFFLLCALPFVFFGTFMAVDLVRLFAAGRIASDAAEAIALGSAQQFSSTSQPYCPPGDTCKYYQPWLDAQQASAVALVMLYLNTHDRGPLERMYTGSTVTVTNQSPTGDPSRPDRVIVRIDYSVPDLSLIPLLNVFSGNGLSNRVDLSITRTADVCTSSYTPTGGACTRPAPGG